MKSERITTKREDGHVMLELSIPYIQIGVMKDSLAALYASCTTEGYLKCRLTTFTTILADFSRQAIISKIHSL